jgi:hypothetical protein
MFLVAIARMAQRELGGGGKVTHREIEAPHTYPREENAHPGGWGVPAGEDGPAQIRDRAHQGAFFTAARRCHTFATGRYLPATTAGDLRRR